MGHPLRYVGTPAQWDVQPGAGLDLVTQSYISFLLSLNLTQGTVNAQISSLLASYATQSSVLSAFNSLATPTYVNAQKANYVPASLIEQPNGPVSVDIVSQLVAPGLINAASTQTWPTPFWSPSGYQSAAVSASISPSQLFTMAIPDPGYDYVLACFGQIDCQVAADDATIPEVVIRNGSTGGQIVATGYGTGEMYSGPAPGQIASQAFLNSSFIATGTATIVSGMLANNTGGYVSTMVGNYLQVPLTMTNATIAASFTFSGAAPSTGKGAGAVTTQCRIADNNGNILVTGTAVNGNSGTCTASYTGTLTVGTLYGAWIGEGAASTFATVTAGTLTITPVTLQNSGVADIIPVPFDQQTSTAGATTLYAMLQSSNNSTVVTANTDFPGLWVMPIPWTAPPPATPPSAVTFDSSSNGTYANVNNLQWTQTLGVNANVLLVGVGTNFASGTYSTWTRTVTAGGVAMTSLGAQINNAAGKGWSELFYLTNPPTGIITISVTETDTGGDTPWISGVSAAYQAVGSLGTPVFSTGAATVTNLATGAIPSAVNGMVVGLLCTGVKHSVTPVNGTRRGVEPSGATASVCQVTLLDAVGTGSTIVLNGTQNSAAVCSAIGVSLNF